ncbi:MAG: FAD-dependent oxidoreductase [Candidatus Abawacabacteria bacterium]|nr:FAD-dependent oxidoreductase [Candidatus Abawacabacteria bacterium]
MNFQKKRIAVIGAGIAGLACAYELQKAGADVVVYEKNSQVGGRMSSRTKDGFVFDLGADHLCDWYDHIKEYCKELGIEWEKMRFLKYGIVHRGSIVSRDEAISWFAKLRLAVQYWRTPKMDSDFFDLSKLAQWDDSISAYDVMRRRIGKKAADYLVDSFCSTYQFHRATEISIAAMLGIINSLKVGQPKWELYRTKGGMQALPNALAKKLTIKMQHHIQKVTAHKDHCLVDQEAFDCVVMATTATTTNKLYQNPTLAQEKVLAAAKYATSISVAYRVPRKLLPDIAVIWSPYIESRQISGFVNEAMKGEELANEKDALLCVWLHEDFAKSLLEKSNEEIFSLIKPELLRICPWFNSAEQLQNHDLERWPEAMPKFYPGYLKIVQSFLASGQGEQNIYFCGDYVNSLWTEGALRGGKRTAQLILNAES